MIVRLFHSSHIPRCVWVSAGLQWPPKRGHWWNVRGIVRRHDFGPFWVGVMAERTNAERFRLYTESLEEDP